jgi:hypothetical protein
VSWVGGVATGRNQRPQAPGEWPGGARTTAVLQHSDGVGKASEAILQAASEKARRERVGKDQAFALAKPLQVTSGPACFERKHATCEFQSQDERLQ